MPLSDYFQFDWRKRHLITSAQRETVRAYFAPFDPHTGKMYDPTTLGNIIAEFSQFYFGDPEQEAHYHIRTAVPEFHRRVYRDLAQELRFYYITCPSGFGKTTVATLVYPLYRALYQLDPYITVGGSSQQLSEEEHFDNIKRELQENEKVIEFFGEQKPVRVSRLTRHRPWSSSEVELNNNVVIRALGCMGRIRGRKTGAIRPTLVIIDDPEEAEQVDSMAVLKSHDKWFFRNVMFRIDKEYGKIRMIGNMLSTSCLLAKVKRDPAWRGVDYSALDDNDRSIWEEKWSTSELFKERQLWADAGRYEEWMFERMNKPVAAKSRQIKYKIVEMEFERRHGQNLLRINQMEPIVVSTWLGIDPEIDAEDFGPRAFITVAKGYFPVEPGRIRPCIFVLDYLFRPLDPSDIIDAIAEKHQRFHYSGVAIEANAWQIIFQRPLNEYIATDEFYFKNPFRVHPIRLVRKAKVTRCLRLQVPGKAGELFVNSEMKAMIDELDYFGAGGEKGLHLLDALEMGERYSVPPEEVVKEWADDDPSVQYRRHVPWKDARAQAARERGEVRRVDSQDAWRHINVRKV